jgi:hypothetical protein
MRPQPHNQLYPPNRLNKGQVASEKLRLAAVVDAGFMYPIE